MSVLRVLVVEDSLVVRTMLERIVNADPRLSVVGSVESGEEALEVLHGLAPDVITMDVCLPGMNGLGVTRQIMAERPTPIVIVASPGASADLDLGLEALRAGAVGLIEKPRAERREHYDALARQIREDLVTLSSVPLVRNRRFSSGVPAVTGPRTAPRPAGPPFALAGLVASTGGPNALSEVLIGLGTDFPLPIALVQHIGAGFVEGFAHWLAETTPFLTHLVDGPAEPRAGTVYLARPERHLRYEHGKLVAVPGDPVCHQVPSGDVLFTSMAANLGKRGVGVLLTGMGRDGADGLRAMYERGAHTLAEDASTAVVYGMPAAAVKLGAVRESLPLGAIAPRLLELACSPCRRAS